MSSIEYTRAAVEMEERADDITPYEVINLMFDGALERVEQAKLSLDCGKEEEAGVLLSKIVGIINGLRESLDLEKGGEIAANLKQLYDYMIARLSEAEADTGKAILSETGGLLADLKESWAGVGEHAA